MGGPPEALPGDPVWTSIGEGFRTRMAVYYAPDGSYVSPLYRFNDDGTVDRFVGWGWRKMAKPGTSPTPRSAGV